MRITILTLICLASAAFADPIQLPSTGQGRPGTIADNRDANYTVTYNPVGASSGASGSAWIAASIDPKWAQDAPWITPAANGMADLPGGVYVFKLSFTLPTGFYALSGSLFVDDRAEVWLNGKLIADLPTDSDSGYYSHTLSFFNTNAGLLTGNNLLEFRVSNTHPSTPVGLAVNTLTATPIATPEPATLLLLCAGLAALSHKLRPRKE